MNDLNKVLIVDNEQFIVEELTEFLQDNGVECVSCVSPAEAISLFNADERIGLVLSDYRMPDMNGIELIQMLSGCKSQQRVFGSILFTGDADKEDVIAAMRAGISDYYQKPLDLESLLAGIKRLQTELRQRHAGLKVGAINDQLREMTSSLLELQQGVNRLAEPGTTSEPAPAPVPPITSLPGFAKLSPRQVEVAELLGKGLTNYQIACELGISENTVKLYVS